MSTTIIGGEIVSSAGHPVADAIIEVIAAATSRIIVAIAADARGAFRDSVPTAAFERLRTDGELRYRVLDRGRLIADEVRAWTADRAIYLVAPTTVPMARVTPTPHVVRGAAVADPGELAEVRLAIAQRGGKRATRAATQPLGTAAPGADGRFEISYARDALRGALRPDLAITAHDGKGRELGRIELRAALATADAALDFESRSTARKRGRALLGTLTGGELDKISPSDVAAVARAAKLAPAETQRLVAAVRTSAVLDVDPDAVFALGRAGLPVTPRALAARKPGEIAAAIATARGTGDLELDDAGAAALASRLERAAIAHALRDPGIGPSAPLYAAIAASGLPIAAQEQVVALERRGGAMRDAIAASALDHATKARALACVDVAAIIDHPPLAVRAIARVRADARELAALELADWIELTGDDAPAAIKGDGPAARGRAYAEHLLHRVERAYPSAFAARRLERDRGQVTAGVLRVLDQPDFVLGQTPVAAYIGERRHLLGGEDEAAHATQQLHILDRLHRLTGRIEDVRPLLGRVDSAAAIARRSRDGFVRRHGHALGERAVTIYEAAVEAEESSLGLAATLHPSLTETGVAAIDGLKPPALATWTTLFGSLDFCACDHCRSVLGPAAYLVDLLEYLERHDGVGAKATPPGSGWTRRSANPPDGRLPAPPSAEWARIERALASAPPALVDRMVQRSVTIDELLASDADPIVEMREDLELDFEYAPPDGLGRAHVAPQTARDVLLRRRHELGRVALSCANTNTVVPHIDLVGELLEVEVARAAGIDIEWPSRIESKGVADDLAIEPEPGPARLQAEDILAAARYPLTAPYEAWGEETRALLDHLGVPLHELRAALSRRWTASGDDDGEADVEPVIQPSPAPGPLGPVITPEPGGAMEVSPAVVALADAYTRACAQLGIAQAERALYAGVNTDPISTRALWGFTGATASVRDPAKPGESITGPWLDVLARVSVALARTGLSYAELAIALAGRTWAGDRPRIAAISGAPDTTCDTSLLHITPLTSDTARQLYKLLRLRRALGWTVAEVDKVVFGLGGTINSRTVVALARIDRLRRRFRRPVLEIAAWWTPLDTYANPAEDEPSHYRRVFLAPSVANPPPRGLTPTALDGSIADHAAPIAAALALPTSDLDVLREALAPALDGELTIDKLTVLFRYASLARVLRTRVADVLALIELSGIQPFAAGSHDAAERFLELGASFVRLRLSADDLRYLLRHERLDRSPLALDPAAASAAVAAAELAVKSVDEALAPAREALEVVDPAAPIVVGDDAMRDPLVAPVRELLASVLDLALVDPAVRLIAAGPGGSDDAATLAALVAIPGLADAGERLTGSAALAGATARLAYVLAGLVFHLRSLRAIRAVVESFASAVRLDPAIASVLLTGHLRSVADPARFAITDYLSDAAVELRLAGYERLYKAAVLCLRAGLTRADLVHVLAPPVGVGWLALDRLPVAPAAADDELFAGLVGLIELGVVRRRFPGGATALRGVLDLALAFARGGSEAPTRDAVLAALSETTDWAVADIERLADRLGLELPRDLHVPGRLDQLARAASVVRQLGVSAAAAIGWLESMTTPAIGRRIAAEVRHAAVARHGRETWRSSARPLVDTLRERRRDAMVAHLVHALGLANADALHGYLLADTQVNACAMTSRIRFAIASVQLFVQRCFLGLEVGVALGAEARQEWEWMSAYRVWEANRKVFLWPENWLYPELRHDKSHLFEALETEIASGGLDGTSAETALRHYVEGLAEIARLEVVGTYRHRPLGSPDGRDDVFHVIARSTASAPRYYHRELAEGVWSPWQRIELDISGPHCFPVVYGGRLFVFWSQLDAVPDLVPEFASDLSPTKDDLEVRLCWSVRNTDTWSPVRRSPPLRMAVGNGFNAARHAKDEVFFVSRWRSAQLVIRCAAARTEMNDDPGSPAYGSVRIGDFEISRAGDIAVCSQPLPDESFEGNALRNYNDVPSEDIMFRAIPDFDGFNRHRQRFDQIEALNKPQLLTGCYVEGSAMLPEGLDPDRNFPSEPSVRTELGERLAQTEAHTLFDHPSGDARFTVPHQYEQFISQDFAFYWDDERSLLVRPSASSGYGRQGAPATPSGWYQVVLFEHPLVRTMLDRLATSGAPGLYAWGKNPIQRLTLDVLSGHTPVSDSVGTVPRGSIELQSSSPYAVYNWELFLHVPLLIADRLVKNRRFEDARRWLHAVFDPTSGADVAAPGKYWNFAPFRNAGMPKTIEQLMVELADGSATLLPQIERWRKHPFEPHRIAAARRTAYQKNVVLRYVDTLIAWADDLFRIDTGESVDEATLLYLLAAEILGPRPREVSRRVAGDRTYFELAPELDAFSNALVEIESLRPPFQRMDAPLGMVMGHVDAALATEADPWARANLELGYRGVRDTPAKIDGARGGAYGRAPSGRGSGRGVPPRILYFGIPPNEKLLERWDTVADRLFKIRCCMNVDGVRRDLPLFEPPIDPELLVRATAAGLDLGQVLANLNAPLPRARFTRLLQLAKELTAEVRVLGSSILAAREKQDGESLARLRATHEIALLDATREVREQRVHAAQEDLAAARAARAIAEHRARSYRGREMVSTLEKRQADETSNAYSLTGRAQESSLLATSYTGTYTWAGAIAGLASGSVNAVDVYDPKLLTMLAEAVAHGFELEATRARDAAESLGMLAAHQRRQESWDLEAEVAELEVARLDRDIVAAELRLAAVRAELSVHDRQREHAREIDEHLREKFTGVALYEWMSAQLGAVYFGAYELAADMARKAERAYQYEIGRSDALFIEASHWDSLRHGLLAGERLARDLSRLEAAYVDGRQRELEIRRHVSLALHAPASLIELKTTGSCTVVLPEALFDADYPGHYFRRLRRVALTVPCVVGAYGTVNCTLTLLDDAIRTEPRYDDGDRDPVRRSGAPIESVVTSSGLDDRGSLELAPIDQLGAFEGSGAVSRWRIALPRDTNDFDLAELTDVILRLDYTARDGGEPFRAMARARLDELRSALELDAGTLAPQRLRRFFSLKHELPTHWRAFLAGAQTGTAMAELPLTRERFPFLFRGRDLSIDRATLAWLPRRPLEPSDEAPGLLDLVLTPPAPSAPLALDNIGPLLAVETSLPIAAPPGAWTLAATRAFEPGSVDDILLALTYTVGPPA